MKGKTKEEIDELVAEKRLLGIENLKRKFKKIKSTMNEPGDIKRYIEKMITQWEQYLYTNNLAIRRNEENAIVAAQLFNKNKIREELKVYRLQKSTETMNIYIKIGNTALKRKRKKEVIMTPPPKKIEEPIVIPDPVAEIIEEPEFIPPPPIIEVPIPLTSEEKKAIKQQVLEAKIAELELEAEFPCPHCGKIYATEPARKRHITMRHKEV